jgi:hypothetical protein
MVGVAMTSVDVLQKVRQAQQNKKDLPNRSTRSMSVSDGQSLPSTAGVRLAALGIPSPQSRKR